MPPVYPQSAPTNTRFYGDNLAMLREYIAELVRGAAVQMPQAQRVQQVGAEQLGFDVE